MKELEAALRRDMRELETGLTREMQRMETPPRNDLTLHLKAMRPPAQPSLQRR